MEIIAAFLRAWLICWIISVVFYIGSVYFKLRAKGIPFRLIDHSNGIAVLLISWPLALVLYLYSVGKSKKKNGQLKK
jgi:hypothetical protein